ESQNGGCCGSSELAIIVPRRSWREIFLPRAEISWDGGDVAPVPRSPLSWGDGRKIQATASVPKKNCLTVGVHLRSLCPILCPPPRWDCPVRIPAASSSGHAARIDDELLVNVLRVRRAGRVGNFTLRFLTRRRGT